MDIDKLREEIEYDEGNVKKIYLDHLGLPTFGIGVSILLGVRPRTWMGSGHRGQ